MKVMKNISALILLFAVSLVIFAVLLIINTVVMMGMSVTSVVLALLISMAVAFGTSSFYKKLHTRLGVNALLFWIFAYAPELIIGAGTSLWGYYQSFRYLFVGVGTLFVFYIIPITGIAYAVWGAIFTVADWYKLKGVQK